MDDQTHVPLGDAPLPATGAELLDRVRPLLQGSTLAPAAEQVLAGTEVVLDGEDVTSWHTDATGVVLAESALRSDTAPPLGPPSSPVTDRARGVVRDLRVQAHPATVADVPVDLDLQLAGLPFDWVTTAAGTVGAQPVEPDAANPVTGKVHVRIPREPLEQLVRRQATQHAAAAGADLRDLDVDLVSTGPRSLAVRVRATVKKGFLGAEIRGGGNATLDDALVLRISDVSLTAANPLVSALIAVVRSRVEAVAARPIDLGSQLPPGVRVTDLTMTVDPDIEVAVTLG